LFSLSPSSQKQKEKKRLWRHTKAPIISTRQIKWRKGRSPTVTEVCSMSHPKANEPWHIWTARVTHYGHCYWPFLVLLDSSLHIFPMVPMVSSSKFRCVSEVFSLSLSLSLSLLSSLFFFYCKLCQLIFRTEKSHKWHLWLGNPS